MGTSHDSRLSGSGAASPPIEEFRPAVVFEAAFEGVQGVGSCLRPSAPGSFESAADDLLADAFHDAGSDRPSALPADAAHSILIGPVGADSGRDRFKPAGCLHVGDDVIDSPCVRSVIDRLHPIFLFALARRGFDSGVRAIEGMAQVEDECRFLSGEGLLAGVADPRRPAGQHRQFLGREQAVPEPDLPQASAEIRAAAGAARRWLN